MQATTDILYDEVMGPGLDPKARAYPGLNPRQETHDGLVIDYDVALQLRDGATIYTDVYRPVNEEGPLPVMLLWSGYGKHTRWPEPMRKAFTQGANVSDYAPVEAQDPLVWCPAGYAVVVPDPRGINSSQGAVTTWSPQEGDDIHDTVEWIAKQPWCTGKIGMGGASSYAIVQWFAGATRPPHLAALMPYDGMSDLYRECARHGGIPNYNFVKFWNAQTRSSNQCAEDWLKALDVHPYFDEYWQSKVPAVENINIPTYLIASWSDHAIHTRGSLSAFMRIGTEQKWLEVHGRNKWARMYTEESTRRQMAFFERFLKGIPNEVDQWPKVRLEVRERIDVGTERAETEWPLARTEYRPFYLDAAECKLSETPLEKEAALTYDPEDAEPKASFLHTFNRETELTGYFNLKLWVEAEGFNDMDLFASIQKFDKAGDLVNFYYITRFRIGHAAHGWLRVSRRELDLVKSRPFQPVQTHRKDEFLTSGQIVPVEIEVWPSSTLFLRGEQMKVVITGKDPFPPSREPGIEMTIHPLTRNLGKHVIHTGGRFDSHVLLPVISGKHP